MFGMAFIQVFIFIPVPSFPLLVDVLDTNFKWYSLTESLLQELLFFERTNFQWQRSVFFLPFLPSQPLPLLNATTNLKKTYWIIQKQSQEGFIKVNFDKFKSSHQVARSYVIRNWVGRHQTAAFNPKAQSNLVVEAIAKRNGIIATMQARFTNMHIKGITKSLSKQCKDILNVMKNPSIISRHLCLPSNHITI